MYERPRVMRQIVECAGVPVRPALLSSWFGRLTGWLSTVREDDRIIQPGSLSRHTLRDIGLAEDVRGNHLLRDEWQRR